MLEHPAGPNPQHEVYSCHRLAHGTITRITPGARPAATFSTIQTAHLDLVARLATTRPHQIIAIADRHDVEERAEHVRDVLGAVLAYIGTVVADTNDNLPIGLLNGAYACAAFPSSPATLPASCSMRPTTWRRGGADHVGKSRGSIEFCGLQGRPARTGDLSRHGTERISGRRQQLAGAAGPDRRLQRLRRGALCRPRSTLRRGVQFRRTRPPSRHPLRHRFCVACRRAHRRQGVAADGPGRRRVAGGRGGLHRCGGLMMNAITAKPRQHYDARSYRKGRRTFSAETKRLAWKRRNY